MNFDKIASPISQSSSFCNTENVLSIFFFLRESEQKYVHVIKSVFPDVGKCEQHDVIISIKIV